jgi:hypothetical protein
MRDATEGWVFPDPALLPTMMMTPLAHTCGQTQCLFTTRTTVAPPDEGAAAPQDTPHTDVTEGGDGIAATPQTEQGGHTTAPVMPRVLPLLDKS